jgi:hypothetical protein
MLGIAVKVKVLRHDLTYLTLRSYSRFDVLSMIRLRVYMTRHYILHNTQVLYIYISLAMSPTATVLDS